VDFNVDDFLVHHSLPAGVDSESGWTGTITSDFSATTFVLTGLDNGVIPYDESTDDDAHTGLLSLLTDTTLVHYSGDTKLHLNIVSGSTGGYVYPVETIADSGITGNYLKFCGGFLQGYYKLDGYDYQVLPTRYEKGWTIETWLQPTDCVAGGTTLNDTYPDNKGFFFYTGTRAENKFWNVFSGNTASGCTSESTGMCMDVKETDIYVSGVTVNGISTDINTPLSPPPIDIKEIENNFLLFGRSNGKVCGHGDSEDGYGQVRADNNYDKDDIYYSQITRKEQVNFQNPFLIFGRSNGKVCGHGDSEDGFGQQRADQSWTGATEPVLELDKDADLVDNALGFRIKDDGSIGYRLLTLSGDCKSTEMIEEYSMSGMVTSDKWEHIVVKWINNDNYSGCELEIDEPRRGKFKFYVNSSLIFTSKELDESIPKRLYDLQEKQVGVPYNISLGGGTQGLIESLTFDGQDPEDLGLLIEKNFAGSFIGYISSFKMYDKNLSWCEIKDSYNNKVNIYNKSAEDFLSSDWIGDDWAI